MRSLALALSLFSAAVVAAGLGPAVRDYPAEKVAPNTYVIHGPVGYPTPENQGFMNNPAFVVTTTGVVVVDPGSSVQIGDMVLRQIRKVTDKKVIAILNTHVHGDHWLGNQAFHAIDPRLPIYGHPNMPEEIRKGTGDSWVATMEQLTQGATRGTHVVGPNITVKNGDKITIGGVDFRFHHAGQAHSTSDVMVEVVQEKVLFLGDNVNNQRIVRMDDGSFTGNAEAIDLALKVPAKVLVPGHGRTGDWAMVRAYRDYLTGLYDAVSVLYEQGVTDFEMKPVVAKKLARFKDWPGFDTELGKHISLAYLEIEKKAF